MSFTLAVLVASLGVAFYCIGSPVSAKLCIRFGCRVVMVSSGLTCALGLLASSFAPNLYVLYLSYGVVVGFATSMVFTAGFQLIPLYFDKHRYVASSMATLGHAAGYLVMCPVTQILLDHLGWRKALLVMAAINVTPVILGCSITRKSTTMGEDQIISTGPSNINRCYSFLRWLDLSVFKDPTFVILTLSALAAVMGHYMPYLHLVILIASYRNNVT